MEKQETKKNIPRRDNVGCASASLFALTQFLALIIVMSFVISLGANWWEGAIVLLLCFVMISEPPPKTRGKDRLVV